VSLLPDVTRFFHPVLAARSLRRGPIQVRVAGRPFALWRDASGRPAAVADSCPHRLAPLSSGRVRPDGRLACGYHGWNFDAEGRGRSPSQPGLTHCDATAFQVVERHGYLWLASRESPLDRFPALGWDEFHLAGSFDTLFRAPLHVALDNFSEDEHFPYIHFFLGWNEAGLGELEYDAKNFDDRTEVLYRGPQRPSPWLPLLGVRAGDRYQNEWTTRFDPVHAVFTFHWFDRKSGAERPLVLRSAVFMVPETQDTTRFHILIFVKIGPSIYRALRPIVHAATIRIGRSDVGKDAAWIRHVADTPLELDGMRLGKFDKPIIRNRRLLRELYWGDAGAKVRGETRWQA
jgi:phenylpropionate dioxygenase-like ring-hydroxylating dioxygenase large terminal subunit